MSLTAAECDMEKSESARKAPLWLSPKPKLSAAFGCLRLGYRGPARLGGLYLLEHRLEGGEAACGWDLRLGGGRGDGCE